jgi:hypothetical protein
LVVKQRFNWKTIDYVVAFFITNPCTKTHLNRENV